jgi:hypothetical protein
MLPAATVRDCQERESEAVASRDAGKSVILIGAPLQRQPEEVTVATMITLQPSEPTPRTVIRMIVGYVAWQTISNLFSFLAARQVLLIIS